MAILIDWLMQPLAAIFIVMLLALAGWLFSDTRSVWLGVCLSSAIGMLWIFSAPVTANGMVRLVESGGHDTGSCPSFVTDLPVIVPGGSLDAYTDSENPYRLLSHDTLLRTLSALEFDGGQNTFHVLGGGVTSRKLSNYMALILIDRGIPEERIVRESESLSTLDNARKLRASWSDGQGNSIVLISSALHLKRARRTFEAQGFVVACAVATGSLYSVSAGWPGYLPFVHSLRKSSAATREWLALKLYQWRGYS